MQIDWFFCFGDEVVGDVVPADRLDFHVVGVVGDDLVVIVSWLVREPRRRTNSQLKELALTTCSIRVLSW